MLLDTAKRHFDEDILRARNLHTHAKSVGNNDLQDDILRSAWMMAVGACDAYFSDAYADLVCRVLQAKDKQPSVDIPRWLNKLKLPLLEVLKNERGGWRWRMAARVLIESENVLSLRKIRDLFNPFLPVESRLLNQVTIGDWITHRDATRRQFGVTSTEYRASKSQKDDRQRALEHFEDRYRVVFQRRHDCIHNCDRPKMSLQSIKSQHVIKIVADIEFLVRRSHRGLQGGFPSFLLGLGFTATTQKRVCGRQHKSH